MKPYALKFSVIVCYVNKPFWGLRFLLWLDWNIRGKPPCTFDTSSVHGFRHSRLLIVVGNTTSEVILLLCTCFQLTVACIKMNRPWIAENAVKIAERRISRDKWPEYYDSKRARFIGKQAHLYQTWSIAGYLVSKLLLANPDAAKILVNVEDSDLANAFSCMLSANPRRNRIRKGPKQSFIV